MWTIKCFYEEVAVKIRTEGQHRGSYAKIMRKEVSCRQRKELVQRSRGWSELGLCEAEKKALVARGELAEGRVAMDGVGGVTGSWSEAMWTGVRSVDCI